MNWQNFYLEHAFLVKWADLEMKGLVPANLANELFPQKVGRMYAFNFLSVM